MADAEKSLATRPISMFADSFPLGLRDADRARVFVDRTDLATMKIIHVLNHCDHGHGNAHVAIDLACVQADRGHQVAYCSAGGDYEELLRRHGVEVVNIFSRERRALSAPGSLARLFSFVRRFRADVVHAHMMFGAVTGAAVCAVTRTPLVTTVHNSFDTHSALMRLGWRIVAVSDAERRSLIAKGYNPKRLDVVINGPNDSPREAFWPPDAGVELETPAITTVCGLHRRKGVFDLIDAFALVSPGHPQWVLQIVGDGPDRESLKGHAASLHLQGRVRFLGSLAHPKAVLDASDIFVLASYADPCSLAVCEARGAGCAIVATAVGGTPELLRFGQAGQLVAPGKPEELAHELSLLMGDPARLAERRAASREGAEFLNVHRLTADYEAVYRRLVVGAQTIKTSASPG